MIRIAIVVDNKGADGFAAEHGFALWLEADGRVILFDTGNQDALSINADKLNLDFTDLTDMVLSHGHYDHTGGIEAVLQKTSTLRVYLHQAAMQPRYSRRDGDARPVRMSAGAMKALWDLKDESIHWLTRPYKITDRIGITGPISRGTDYEDTGGAFFYDPWGERPDPIEDDNAVWVHTGNGLVICVGCSHAGIVNTIETVIEVTGETKIHTVIGGLHLLNASQQRLEQTAQALNSFDIGQLIACHCTGDEAFAYLEKRVNCKIMQGYAGFSMMI
ncbi:MAG: MBL fold metallo-hydrolase [Desulfofustis sp.]|jgi:7,8-dihydropterin-6-yl-methyl-4-(beta-D-ribofuranosyl)aminobenzene 5'-phosphate synthase|nr:MBL fold metallo-hydrolase [Desulfofustis sp.]